MSLVDSLKKGLFGSEDDYDDQYMDDGPQMVNNNNGVGIEDDEEGDIDAAPKKKGKEVNSRSALRMPAPLQTT